LDAQLQNTPAGIVTEAAAVANDESLDQLLVKAMDKNPSIAAAKAKIALAQAELNAAQLETSQKILGLWNEKQSQERSVKATSERVKQMKTLIKDEVSAVNATIAEKDFVDQQAKLARIKGDLKALTGEMPAGMKNATYTFSGSGTLVTATAGGKKTLPAPQGAIAERIRRTLETTANAEFTETPLSDICDYLRDVVKDVVKGEAADFVFDNRSLGDLGVTADTPVTLRLKSVPIWAILQAIEDQLQIKFVVRDYGIVASTPDAAETYGYQSAIDFVHQDKPLEGRPVVPTPLEGKPAEGIPIEGR
jgi:hypothetical protein